MSEMVMMGVAATFGGALALFVVTSFVALPMIAYDTVRAPARSPAKSRRR